VSNPTLTRKQLLERYVQAAWVLKLRLISARRNLWADTTSLIHIETALLQLRKSCEAIGYLCVLAAEVEFERMFSKHRKSSEVGKIFKALKAADALRFPRPARRILEKEEAGKSHWRLEVDDARDEDHKRVARIQSRSGDLLHEKSPYIDWPSNPEAAIDTLVSLRNAVRRDHQWLWNRFWVHSVSFRHGIFVVELGQDTNFSQPMIIKQDTLVEEDLVVRLDPGFVADFHGELKWPSDT
jgi:hypothetical protein